MRTLAGQEAQVEALNERSSFGRVEIDRTGSGDWVNLSDYEGLDWFDGADYADNGDSPVGDATVRIKREWHELSLSPLKAQSKLNQGGVLVWPKRKFRLKAAIMPRGVQPSASDWMEVFTGRLDRVNWQSSPMELKGRDKGGDLQDGWIETQQVYGTAGGRALELVMQDILDDAYTSGWIPEQVTLYSITGDSGTPFKAAESPSYNVIEWKQGREPVMDALQKLARLIGWECRYRWNSNESAFKLTLYEPARPVRSRGTITVSGDPSASETFQISSVTYTAKSSGAGTDEFNIAAGDTGQTAQNIADMLNEGSGSGEINAWRDGSTVIVEWQDGGVAGDAVTFTESMSNASMDGGGTLGGTRGGVDATVVHTFAPQRYFDVDSLSIDVSQVRNAFSGTFHDSDGIPVTVTRRNAASIVKYNRRPLIFTAGATEQIDSITEMIDFLDAADNDLAEPDLGHGITVPYFPWGEAGDLYRFEANGKHYDSDQDLAAVTLRHRLMASGRSTTMIESRGKPALGPSRWLEAEGRPGVAPPPDVYEDAAPTNVTVAAGLGTIIVTYDDPRTMDIGITDWLYTECHVSTSNGFTPSSSTLAAKGRTTRFEVNGLNPGVTYYAKLVVVDDKGNKSTVSTQVTTATQRVGPYHENLDGQQDQLLRNNDFNIFTNGTDEFPDGWGPGFGAVWDDDVYADSGSESATGNYAIVIDGTVSSGDTEFQTDELIPFTGGDIAQASAVAKDSGGGMSLEIRLEWFDIGLSSLSSDSESFQLDSSYQTLQMDAVKAPASAAYVRVVLGSNCNEKVYVDKAGLVRGYANGNLSSSDVSPFDTSLHTLTWSSGDERGGDIGFTHADNESKSSGEGDLDNLEVQFDGGYQPTAEVLFSGDGTAYEGTVEIQLDEGATGSWTTIANGQNQRAASGGTNGIIIAAAAPVLQLRKGDLLRVRFTTSIAAGTGRSVSLSNFSVRQLVRVEQ